MLKERRQYATIIHDRTLYLSDRFLPLVRSGGPCPAVSAYCSVYSQDHPTHDDNGTRCTTYSGRYATTTYDTDPLAPPDADDTSATPPDYLSPLGIGP